MTDFTTVYDLTVPAGNTSLARTFFNTPLGNCEVERILVRFPPGCAGLVGAQIWAGGSPAYPYDIKKFFIFDDYVLDHAVTSQPTGGQWGINAYNSDYFAHDLHVVFMCNYLSQSPGLSSGQPLSI